MSQFAHPGPEPTLIWHKPAAAFWTSSLPLCRGRSGHVPRCELLVMRNSVLIKLLTEHSELLFDSGDLIAQFRHLLFQGTQAVSLGGGYEFDRCRGCFPGRQNG